MGSSAHREVFATERLWEKMYNAAAYTTRRCLGVCIMSLVHIALRDVAAKGHVTRNAADVLQPDLGRGANSPCPDLAIGEHLRNQKGLCNEAYQT